MGYLQASEQTAPKVANILSAFQSTTTTTASSSTATITSNTSHNNEEKGQNPKPVEEAQCERNLQRSLGGLYNCPKNLTSVQLTRFSAK